MAKRHGAGDQKKLAKKKAKRSEKRDRLMRRDSKDPTIRLQPAGKWPIVGAYVGSELWEDGIGYLAIARQEVEGRLVFASFLVDVYCLGVKDTFWDAGSPGDFKELLRRMETTQSMLPISPACLVKIVEGSVRFAESFGFRPHPDYRHTSSLLKGIDPQECPNEYTFGREEKPFYIQGPNESFEEARAIMQQVRQFGGHYVLAMPSDGEDDLDGLEDDFGSPDNDEDLEFPRPFP